MTQHDLFSVLWFLCHLHSTNVSVKQTKRVPHRNTKHWRDIASPHTRKQTTRLRGVQQQRSRHSTSRHPTRKLRQQAYMSQHDLAARNKFPATDLEKGWIIDSGASAHMTPFKADCKNIQPTYKIIYLADGSTVLCRFMGNITIPITKNQKILGSLILEDVLIVPNLDRRLFSVNAFLSHGHNWVNFSRNNIKLGIRDGPSINIPITSLQSKAFVVDHLPERNKPKEYSDNATLTSTKKTKVDTGLLHARLHRPDGVLATIRAHDLWRDVEVTQGIDPLCTSCKIMTIPAHARGKPRESTVSTTLDEIQVDTVPNPEPMGLSADSRFNYFLILCDRYSRLFRICGIKDKTTDACIDGIELIISTIPGNNRQPKAIRHIRSDAGTEFRSDTFRKWCSENKIHFTSAAPKHQEQNGMVERHWGTIAKLANTLLLHARLNRKFFYYAVKYAQYIHDVIPVRNLQDKDGLPTTPYMLATGRKPTVKHFRVFGCPAIFKRYEVSSDGKRIKNKYNQQGMRGIFVGIPDDASGWLFYVPSAKRSYISMDAVFDESFTSPLVLPDLPYQGAIKLRGFKNHVLNQDAQYEQTGPPSGTEETFPHDDYDMPRPTRKHTISDISDLVTHSKRGNHTDTANATYVMEQPQNMHASSEYDKSDVHDLDNHESEHDNKIMAYFSTMEKLPEDINNAEYLNMAHEQQQNIKQIEKSQDTQINLSDFIPEPKSLSQVLRLSPVVREKWGISIRNELLGLFDNDTFDTTEKALPADEVIPVKCAFKAKLNSYGGLDKLKARICVRGDMQVKDTMSNWSPTASVRLLKCFLADAIRYGAIIYQLDFIQAFIQSPTNKRIFVILDKEYETFCPQLSEHLGRPLRLKKCLYGADFSGKSWYETLDQFLQEKLGFARSRVEGCLYIYRKGNDWIKMINYVDDALYFASKDSVRERFELSLKSKFNLTLMGKAKWYLGMRIRQHKDYIILDQDQYVKNITSRFEKQFKHPFKLKDSPLPSSFVPSKKDSPKTETEVKEVKLRFGNMNYRSIIGALLYVSCSTRPDISYAVNKLAKFASNPGVTHFRAILHLIGFIKSTSHQGIKFYAKIIESPLFQMLKENNIKITEETVLTFTDSSWNDCIDTGRSTGGYITFRQAGAVDYGSHLPVPVAMSSGEAEYISAAVACMKASHIRMLEYDLKFLGTEMYDINDPKYEPARIIIDNEAAIAMTKCNKDTAGNRHVARRYHYVRQGTNLNEHKFEWIGTKHQLADPLTKSGTPGTFGYLWSMQLANVNDHSDD